MSDPREAQTGYKDGEGFARIAPLVGWPPEDVAAFVVVALDHDGQAGFGASSAIDAKQVPRILRAMADGIEDAVNSPV